MNSRILSRRFLLSDTAILIYLALVKLLVHLFTGGNYGYFRDELYYLAATEHLDIGYVDIPPVVPVLAAFSRWLFGDSLIALHILPAVAGAVTVFLAGLMARELDGGRFAQWMTALAVLLAPQWLGFNSMFTYDPFDQLVSIIFFYLVIRILKADSLKVDRSRLWLWFGVIAGLGLMVKLSMMFLGFGLVVALLLTKRRSLLAEKWPWIAGLIVLVIITPYLIWQTTHGWPLLEYWKNYALHKTYQASPLEFLLNQIVPMNILAFPLWILGLSYFLFHAKGKQFRVLSLIYLVLFVFFMVTHMKYYLLTATYFMLFAGGAIWLEQWTGTIIKRGWLRFGYALILLAGGIMMAPYALPVLPVESMVKYLDAGARLTGIKEVKTERLETNILPQHYADRFGWENLAKTVANVYHELGPDEQLKCAIFTRNYGEAGAIDFFGKDHGLPRAICPHLSYHIWGPRDYTGELMIVLGGDRADLLQYFERVEQKVVITHQFVMPYENNLPVFLCRNSKAPLKTIWPGIRSYN